MILSVAILVGPWLLTSCGKKEELPAPPPPTVIVAKPVAKKIVEHAEYTGRLAAVNDVDVRPRVGGYIFEIHFKDGALVKKGDLLFTIDPRPYQASLGQAQGQLKEALANKELTDSNYARAKTLDATRVSSKQEFDTSTANRNQGDAKVATAQAAVDSAQLNLDFTRIIAPIDGRVSREQVTVGNLVAPDFTLLTTIVSVDPVYAYADVDERTVIAYQQMVKEGKVPDARDNPVGVGIALAGEKDFPHQGVVDFVDIKLASGTGTLPIRGSFPNPEGNLLPGMFIRMQLPTSPEHDGLLVADRAVGSDQGQKFLMVVKGNKVEQKPVVLGPVIGGLRVVKKGIDPNDQVIVDGIMKARPGESVKIEQGDMAKYASDELEAASAGDGSGK